MPHRHQVPIAQLVPGVANLICVFLRQLGNHGIDLRVCTVAEQVLIDKLFAIEAKRYLAHDLWLELLP